MQAALKEWPPPEIGQQAHSTGIYTAAWSSSSADQGLPSPPPICCPSETRRRSRLCILATWLTFLVNRFDVNPSGQAVATDVYTRKYKTFSKKKLWQNRASKKWNESPAPFSSSFPSQQPSQRKTRCGQLPGSHNCRWYAMNLANVRHPGNDFT